MGGLEIGGKEASRRRNRERREKWDGKYCQWDIGLL